MERAQGEERRRAGVPARHDGGENGDETTEMSDDGERMRRVLSEMQKHGWAKTPSKNFDAASLHSPRGAVLQAVLDALRRANAARGGTVEDVDETKKASTEKSGCVGIFVAEASVIGEGAKGDGFD